MSLPVKFLCSICKEQSYDICAWCTKDICRQHRCARCRRCSDCCQCEHPMDSLEPALPETAP